MLNRSSQGRPHLVTFDGRPEHSEEGNHVDVQEKVTLVTRICYCKGLSGPLGMFKEYPET